MIDILCSKISKYKANNMGANHLDISDEKIIDGQKNKY